MQGEIQARQMRAVGRQSLANYKGCMVYKELQKSFFHYLLVFYIMEKNGNTHESQSRTELANIQTRLVQPGRAYASITRTESRQPITSRNNQKIQEKIVSPNRRQLIVGAIQAQGLQYVLKEYMEKIGAMFNTRLATLITKIT